MSRLLSRYIFKQFALIFFATLFVLTATVMLFDVIELKAFFVGFRVLFSLRFCIPDASLSELCRFDFFPLCLNFDILAMSIITV